MRDSSSRLAVRLREDAANGIYEVVDEEELTRYTRSILFAERFRTERDLRLHGLFETIPTEHIPGIDTIANFKPFPFPKFAKRNWTIEVIGMPRAGKDTLIEKINSLGNSFIYCTLEPYSQLRDGGMLAKQGGNLQQHQIHAATFGEFIAGEVELRKKGVMHGGVSILNRSFANNRSFSRARFLYGDTPIHDYYADPERWIFHTTGTPDALFIFMQSIDTSMRRKINQQVGGHHINPDFLELLRAEYLRDIMMLRRKKQPNLVVLNTEGTIDGNFSKFRNFMSAITRLRL